MWLCPRVCTCACARVHVRFDWPSWYVVDEWFRGVAARVASLQRRITEFRTQCSGPLRASRQPLDLQSLRSHIYKIFIIIMREPRSTLILQRGYDYTILSRGRLTFFRLVRRGWFIMENFLINRAWSAGLISRRGKSLMHAMTGVLFGVNFEQICAW